jgi:hypothetical protein
MAALNGGSARRLVPPLQVEHETPAIAVQWLRARCGGIRETQRQRERDRATHGAAAAHVRHESASERQTQRERHTEISIASLRHTCARGCGRWSGPRAMTLGEGRRA